jgi:RNA polymerase sigma-70 factor, ECF subfamily
VLQFTSTVNTRIEEAVKRLQSGDAAAVEEALEYLTTSAYAFAVRMCGNREDAQDVAQETMVRLAPSLNKFPNGRGLGLWLYKVAKTRCLMSRRLSKFAPTHRLSLDELMPSPHDAVGLASKPWPASPEEVVLRQELREQLERAILSLPKPYRLVLVLRDVEQLDTHEVAKVLGITAASVKMRLHRARVSVRNVLDEYFRSTSSSTEKRHGRPEV